MLKKILFGLTVACFFIPVQAWDWNAPIKQIVTCSDSWFEVELSNQTMYYNGIYPLVRFQVKSANVGAEKYKQMFAMALTSFATQTNMWVGTRETSRASWATGGNCGTNNVPAQTVLGMAVYR